MSNETVHEVPLGLCGWEWDSFLTLAYPGYPKTSIPFKESQCYILYATFHSFSFGCQIKVRFLESLSRDKALYASVNNYGTVDVFKSRRLWCALFCSLYSYLASV